MSATGGNPSSAKTIADLRALSDEELIEQHDRLALRTAIGIDYYLAELARPRQTDRRGCWSG